MEQDEIAYIGAGGAAFHLRPARAKHLNRHAGCAAAWCSNSIDIPCQQGDPRNVLESPMFEHRISWLEDFLKTISLKRNKRLQGAVYLYVRRISRPAP